MQETFGQQFEDEDFNAKWVQWGLDCEEYLYEVIARQDLSDSAKLLFCVIMDTERCETQCSLTYESMSQVLSWSMDKVKDTLTELVDANAVYAYRENEMIVCKAMVQREINKLNEP